jgi:AcrR family transcriptional regulator
VDAVAEAAGHAKPTLYELFGSKENLLAEVLQRAFDRRREGLEAQIRGIDNPRERLVAVLNNHQTAVASKGFRGCPLVNASVELPESEPARQITQRYKRWYREFISSLAREAGLRAPDQLAYSVVLLLEGANVLSYVERDPSAGRRAREAALALIDLHASPARHG